MATSIEEIIKTHICEEIFQNGYPGTLKNMHPFDFFIKADIDATEDVESSPLGTEWNFKVASEYGFDNIRAIRGSMQNMYSDLEKLKTSLFKYAVKPVMVSIDDFENTSNFYNFIQSSNAILQRQGTADEYATVLTVDAEVIS